MSEIKDFDFVLDLALRQSLVSDYKEMQTAYDGGAWKAAQVIGGSIVETLLLDYLLAEGTLGDQDEANFKSLESLIVNAFKAKLISERVKEQALLIKRYRNLIHQGKALRTREKCDRNSAMTTVALLNMVLEEVAQSRKETYGLTADQFCNKVMTDPRNTSILSHLLKGMRPQEIERLLCAVLPSAAFASEPYGWDEFDTYGDGDPPVGIRRLSEPCWSLTA